MQHKGTMDVDQMQLDTAIKTVISALQTAGYDPYMQLLGYVKTGELAYITRQGEARELVEHFGVNRIKDFLKEHNRI